MPSAGCEAFSEALENKSGQFPFKVVLAQPASLLPCRPLRNEPQKCEGAPMFFLASA